jgi:hypothetical protein
MKGGISATSESHGGHGVITDTEMLPREVSLLADLRGE